MPTTLPNKPHSDYRVTFYNASRPHALTLAQQLYSREKAIEQHTINIGTIWELFEDWFSRIGLRVRMKTRLYIRLARAAMGPVFGR